MTRLIHILNRGALIERAPRFARNILNENNPKLLGTLRSRGDPQRVHQKGTILVRIVLNQREARSPPAFSYPLLCNDLSDARLGWE